MFCTQCGNPLYEDDAFCADCGKKITPRASKPEASEASHATPAGPAFRRRVAAPLANDMPNYDQPMRRLSTEYDMPVAHRRQSSISRLQTIIAVICIAMLVVSLGIIGFSFLRNVQTGAAETPSSPTADETAGTGEGPYEPDQAPPETGDEPGQLGSARFPFPGTLSRYSANTADISFLQNTLNTIRNHYTSVRPIEVVGGIFDGATRGAVIDFQVRAGLTPTGVVDETTWYGIIAIFENPPETPDPPFIPTVGTNYITLVNLHLREAPSSLAYSLGIMPEGTSVWVVSYIPGDRWFFVTTQEDEVGYMKAEFLLMEGILP